VLLTVSVIFLPGGLVSLGRRLLHPLFVRRTGGA
jgi:hypothetical protein